MNVRFKIRVSRSEWLLFIWMISLLWPTDDTWSTIPWVLLLVFRSSSKDLSSSNVRPFLYLNINRCMWHSVLPFYQYYLKIFVRYSKGPLLLVNPNVFEGSLYLLLVIFCLFVICLIVCLFAHLVIISFCFFPFIDSRDLKGFTVGFFLSFVTSYRTVQ